MAPSVNKWVPCKIVSGGDASVEGVSQAISELGVIVRLINKENLQMGQKVEIQMNWEDRSIQRYPAEVAAIGSDQGYPLLQLYFDGLNF